MPARAKSIQMSPGTAGGASRLIPRSRPVSSQVSRSAASGKARAYSGLGSATRSSEFLFHFRMQFARRRHGAVKRLDAPAGKHKLAGHEFVAGVAAAEQHFRPGGVGAVDQHQRRGVTRLAVGERLVAFLIGHPLGPELSEVLRHRAFRCFRRCRECLPRSCRDGRCCVGRRLASTRPSERSSKRSAPATGAASTSFTVTGSPSR